VPIMMVLPVPRRRRAMGREASVEHGEMLTRKRPMRRFRCICRCLHSSSGSGSAAPPPPPADFRCPVDSPKKHDEPGSRSWFCPVAAVRVYETPPHLLTNDAAALGDALRQDGFVVMRQALPLAWVEECSAAFTPRLKAHIRRIGANVPTTRNRGPFRHYVDLPMVQPFAALADHPLVGGLVANLLGPNAAAERLASDTPLGTGSVYQSLHLDLGRAGPFSPAGQLLRPQGVQNDVADALVFNWGLVNIDERNGPVEIAPGSHRFPLREAHRRIADGRTLLLRVTLRKGDLLLRDLRTLHRGSPNVRDQPRPHLTLTFSPTAEAAAAKGNICPGIQRTVYEGLGGQGQHLLRAIKRMDGCPHAALGSNKYPMY
jgi:hypothetical protein